MDEKIIDLESFVDRLIIEKGLEGLDIDIQNEVHADLLNRIEDRINATLLANLPSVKVEEFSELLDTNNEKNIQEFISTHIQNVNEVVAETLMSFRQTYLKD